MSTLHTPFPPHVPPSPPPPPPPSSASKKIHFYLHTLPLPSTAKRQLVLLSRFHQSSVISSRTLRNSTIPSIASTSAGEPHNPSSTEEEAREAVVDVLQESGASREDAVEIASKCPEYVRKLIENVRELDEHSLWSSWKGKVGVEEVARFSFKEKVYHMAKEKGDNGVLPFLESVGIGRSALMRIAGFVSSEGLPDLIHKVKYIQGFVFTESGHEMIIGKNARRMMIQLSIPVEDDLQQTMSFFEKMEARRGGLNKLGFAEFCLPFLMESFPRLLLLSVENHLKPLFEFLHILGVPQGNIKDIVLLFPPFLFYNLNDDLKPKINALRKVGGEDDAFVKILLKYPWILSTTIQVNYKEILSFFDTEKVPKSCVEHAIRSWPHLLGCSTSKMETMVERLGAFGVRNKMLGAAISSSPQLFLRKPSEFLEVVTFLEDVGLNYEMIGRILCRSPEIFASDVKNTLMKKINLLVDFGISSRHLPRVIKKYPELLVSDVQDTLLPRMRYLLKMGLSRKDVASMIHRFSPLLGYSVEVVLKPKLEYLLRTMGLPLKEVVEYPRYFSYSLEKKIKPRYYVLKGRNIQCSLKDMLGKNDEEFAEKYMGIGSMSVLPSPMLSGSQPSEEESIQ